MVEHFRALGVENVESHELVDEDVHFSLPVAAAPGAALTRHRGLTRCYARTSQSSPGSTLTASVSPAIHSPCARNASAASPSACG